MDEITLWRYERCSVCDGRGLISIFKKHNPTDYDEIIKCDICLGTGQLKIHVKEDDLG